MIVVGAGTRKRRISAAVTAAVLVGGAGLAMIAPSGAVDGTAFNLELDGNILPTTAVDWQNTADPHNGLFDATHNVTGPISPMPAGFTNAKFVKDFGLVPSSSTADYTTFTNGSADISDVSGWSCVGVQNVTDKGDITNAYATAFRDPVTKDLVLAFGMEKNSSNGDNNIGVWFLRDGTVSCDNTRLGGSGKSFSGHHMDGDVLLAASFTGGGTTPTVKAYFWHGDATGFMDSTASATGTKCGDPAATETRLCAITNVGQQLSPPWPTATKTGTGVPSLQFYEGAADITALGDEHCFASFLGNTRASQSTTAALYDYASGSMPTCGTLAVHKYIDADLSLSKTPGDLTADPPPSPATVGVSLWSFTVKDSNNAVICSGTTDASGNLVCTTGGLSSIPPGDYTITETQKPGFFNTQAGTTTGINTAATVSKTITVGTEGGDVSFGNTCFVTKTFEIDGVPAGQPQLFVDYTVTSGYDASVTHKFVDLTTSGTTATGSVGNLVQNDVISWSWGEYSGATRDTAHEVVGSTGESLATSGYPTCAKTNKVNFPFATLNGTKYKDVDANGSRGATEGPLQGFHFQLMQGTTQVGTDQASAADGTYSFANVAPGSYTVHEVAQTGWNQTQPAAGADATVTVNLGDTSVTIGAFGNTPLSKVKVDFLPQAKNYDGTDATKATSISCVPAAGATQGNTNSNTFTTGTLTDNQSSLVCTVTFIDP